MAVATYDDLINIDAQINATVQAERDRLNVLANSTWVPSRNDKALADIRDQLTRLWAEKRAIVASLEYRRQLPTVPRLTMCTHPGCQNPRTQGRFCGHHRVRPQPQPYRPWITSDDARLLDYHRMGKPINHIAALLGRNPSEVQRRINTINSYHNRQEISDDGYDEAGRAGDSRPGRSRSKAVMGFLAAVGMEPQTSSGYRGESQ